MRMVAHGIADPRVLRLASDGWEPAAACAVRVAILLMVGLAGGKNDAEGFPGTR